MKEFIWHYYWTFLIFLTYCVLLPCTTYINSNSFMMVENGYFWVICRNVSVKLLLIEIPLDTKKEEDFNKIIIIFQKYIFWKLLLFCTCKDCLLLGRSYISKQPGGLSKHVEEWSNRVAVSRWRHLKKNKIIYEYSGNFLKYFFRSTL